MTASVVAVAVACDHVRVCVILGDRVCRVYACCLARGIIRDVVVLVYKGTPQTTASRCYRSAVIDFENLMVFLFLICQFIFFVFS